MIDIVIAFLLGGFIGVFIGILMMPLFAADKGWNGKRCYNWCQ